MVGIVIVSHSAKIAEGIKELALQMAPEHKGIVCAGGMEDGSIGTDAVQVAKAIQQANDGDGVVILADLGSGIMSAETAMELLEGEEIRAVLADAPLVEGCMAAVVKSAYGAKMDEVLESTERTREVTKTNRGKA